MFTGIIQDVGRVRTIESCGGDLRIIIEPAGIDLADVQPGDSIAVNGCCLTAVSVESGAFAVDVSIETLGLTTLGELAAGDAVNLEKALRLSDRLGGHLVSGHVDGVGEVVSVADDGRSQRWRFQAPAHVARYIAVKGSITVDGVSLTVNEADGGAFGVNLIPHTLEHTTFHARAPGDLVNLEVDLVARYVERLLLAGDPPEQGDQHGITGVRA